MKIICMILTVAFMLVVVSNAEAPRQGLNQRQNNFFQRQLTPPAAFTSSGWQPQGKPIVFPSSGQQQQQQPQSQPQQPPEQYGPPPNVYGPPSSQPETTSDNLDLTTVNIEAEIIQSDKKKNQYYQENN